MFRPKGDSSEESILVDLFETLPTPGPMFLNIKRERFFAKPETAFQFWTTLALRSGLGFDTSRVRFESLLFQGAF